MNQNPLRTDVFAPVHQAISRLGQYEWTILLAVILIIGGIWLTEAVAEEVTEGATHEIDRRILLALRETDDPEDPLGPLWFEQMIRDFTSLGGTGVLVLLVTAASGYLFLLRDYRNLVVLLLAVIGATLISYLLKDVFGRPRPDIFETIYTYNASFPSGHALLAAATYLTLGSFLAEIQTRFRLKAFILLLSILVMLIVGFSRVYLGVHWPSDVLAGWTIGAVWALLCWLFARWLHNRSTAKSM